MKRETVSAGRLFKIGIPGPVLDDETKKLLEIVDPLAIIFFGRNIESPEQLSSLIAAITGFMGRKPVFAIDQEGGIVTRLTEGFTIMPGPMALAHAGGGKAAYEAALILGTEMKAVGIDWDLAPVVDVNRNPDNRAIGIRSFSSDRDVVISCASAFVKGLSDAGILSCLKHFPGLGGASVDPHIDLPVLDISLDELNRTDIPPFLEIECPCWMPTHIYLPALQGRKEAVTVSSEVLTDFVRGKLGFKGVLLADDLNMGGVAKSSSIEDLAVQTFRAGMDIISICEGSERQIRAFKALSGAVSEDEFLYGRFAESIERIDRILSPYEGKLVQNPDKIATTGNRTLAMEISGKTFTRIKEEEPLPPPASIDNIFSMKRQRLVMVEEEGEGLFYAAVKASGIAGCPLREIRNAENEARPLVEAATGKRNIVFTENAHLDDEVSSLITQLAKVSKSLHLIALRNPRDADITGVKNAYCSYGYTPDQQKAVLNFISGGKKF